VLVLRVVTSCHSRLSEAVGGRQPIPLHVIFSLTVVGVVAAVSAAVNAHLIFKLQLNQLLLNATNMVGLCAVVAGVGCVRLSDLADWKMSKNTAAAVLAVVLTAFFRTGENAAHFFSTK
jgi:hypothetical protein